MYIYIVEILKYSRAENIFSTSTDKQTRNYDTKV